MVFIHSVDGRVHRQQFECIAPFGLPMFIDKPFDLITDDARAIVDIAHSAGLPVMSCSALRYADPFVTAVPEDRV